MDHSGPECLPVSELEDKSVSTGGARMSHVSGIGAGWPGSVPFVSHRPGAYSCLLLAVYVRWKMGLLVASDWLRPVTRGGGGEGGPTSHSVRCGWL